jgi:methionyl-tRNA synthetase
MVHRYRDGRVPASSPATREPADREIQRATDAVIAAVKSRFTANEVSLALQEIWSLIGDVNKYIVEREPWKLAKDDAKRDVLDRTLYHAADTLRVVAALVDPVMPDSAGRIRTMLGVTAEPWTTLAAGGMAPGTQLGAVEPLFPRIEKTVEELRAMTTANDSTPPVPPEPSSPASSPVPASAIPAPAAAAAVSPPATVNVGSDGRIAIDDFMRVELRVAKVLEAEAVPKSKKLIKLKVDVGTEQRTIVAGIAEAYQPEQLVGRTIVIVANLKPAKLMGIESNGMVLAASPEGGLPSLVAVDPALPAGSRVR